MQMRKIEMEFLNMGLQTKNGSLFDYIARETLIYYLKNTRILDFRFSSLVVYRERVSN